MYVLRTGYPQVTNESIPEVDFVGKSKNNNTVHDNYNNHTAIIKVDKYGTALYLRPSNRRATFSQV